ncbi:MAG: response regulator transcription factor [Bacteroidota bacterium]
MTEPNRQYSILLADDHQLVIDGIKSMLVNESKYAVTAEANNGQQALDIITAAPEKYDVVLTDVNMAPLTGIELCRKVKELYPDIKVLIVSMYNSMAVVKEAMQAEADGYMVKNSGKQDFLQALHRITDGGTYYSQDIIPIIYSQYQKEKQQDEELSHLTLREREILSLIVKELTSEEIGERLFISKKTVDNHRKNMLEKCNCKSTIGLVKYAIRNGVRG